MKKLTFIFILISLNLPAQKPVEISLKKKYAAERLVKDYCEAIIGITKDKAESVAMLSEMIIERMDNESWDDIKTGVPISFNRYFTILSEEKPNIQFTRIPTRKDFLYYAGETEMNGEKVRIPYIVAPLTKTVNGKQVTGYLAIRPGNIKIVDYRKNLPLWAVVYDNDGNIYKNKASQQEIDEGSLFFLSLAKQGNYYAQYDLAINYLKNKKFKQAFYWFNKSAIKFILAQYKLGHMYAEGLGVKQDYQKAIYWYKKAADMGDERAQNDLGIVYDKGLGVKQDYQKAVYWYKKAADKGYAIAQSNLGVMFDKGLGINQNYQKAVFWYKKAADQENAIAQYNLAQMYYLGLGVSQDYQKAFYWYKKAADKGNGIAQNNLGAMYSKGIGVKQDYQKAFYWYKKAADKGISSAQYNLGNYYYKGKGIETNYNKAFYWYKKAANQGDATAQYNLGYMYKYGKGVQKDSQKAKYWYKKACDNGHKKACKQLKN